MAKQSIYSHSFKRIFDVVLSLIAIIILSPLLLLAAIVIFVESGWPILYNRDRVGQNLKIFRMYKFRSMVKNADQVGGYSTAQNDSRITRVGHFIRRTSIDELPQLFNVLLGSMSLIGPRPDVPKQVEQYPNVEIWKERHLAKPGITGLSQALFRSSGTIQSRIEHDLYYVKNISFALDLKILFQTFKVLLDRSKAN